jgi:hypothetical protein
LILVKSWTIRGNMSAVNKSGQRSRIKEPDDSLATNQATYAPESSKLEYAERGQGNHKQPGLPVAIQ